ncbi:hypothetical protein B0H13DRAFT_2349623 [Mycena leptocephala]|nr:hypothetical protein B0H13DRAFT_2349623 [Mycena leptocephala]
MNYRCEPPFHPDPEGSSRPAHQPEGLSCHWSTCVQNRRIHFMFTSGAHARSAEQRGPRGADFSALRCFIINSRSPSPVALPRSSDDPPPYAPAFPASTSRQPSDTADVYAIRIGRQGEIFHSAAEARARFKALERAGSVAGFVISSSVDNCIAWINSAPSDAEVRAVENVQWASDDETDELRIANVSLEE